MKADLSNRKAQLLLCIIIGLCFMWTGSGYLSWLYNLIENCPNVNADLHSEVIGYIFQAVGIGFFAIAIKLNKKLCRSFIVYLSISLLDLLLICGASFATNTTQILIIGYGSNIAHGLVAGFYLALLIQYLPPMQRGLCFGVGYSIGSLGSYLLSIIGKNNFITSDYVWIAYAGMILLSAIAFVFLLKNEIIYEETGVQSLDNTSNDNLNSISNYSSNNSLYKTENKMGILYLIIIASFSALLISLVKNLGFYFPMADISSGTVSLEFTRLFYAIGLIIAGFINDINRKYGIFACLITLFFPFLLLLLEHQYQSSLIIWIIGYTFTGFYTVYRVLLLGDLIKGRDSLLFISGFGLLFGRIGDALGAFIGIRMTDHISVLVCITIVFYITATIIIMILFEKIYIPDIIRLNKVQIEVSNSTNNTAFTTINSTVASDNITNGATTSNSSDASNTTVSSITSTSSNNASYKTDSDTTFTDATDNDNTNSTIQTKTLTSNVVVFEKFVTKYELSKREQEILRLALTNMTNTNIASELFISVNTTKFHIRNILKKTGCANRNELKELYNNSSN